MRSRSTGGTSASTRTIALVLAILVIGAIAIAGAAVSLDGGRSDTPSEDFSAGYRTITQTYQQRIEATKALREKAKEPDDAAAKETYRAILTATDDARDDYADLDPPDADKDAFAAFVKLLDDQSAQLLGVVSAAEAGDRTAINSGLQEYGRALTQWILARQTFDKKTGFSQSTGGSGAA